MNELDYEFADDETEAQLDETEKKLTALYVALYLLLLKKAKKYLSDYKAMDDKQKAAFGKDGEKDYIKWRIGTLATGLQWADFEKDFVKATTETNLIARGVINEQVKNTFELNANYTAYQIETKARITDVFDLVDKPTIERLITQRPDLFPKLTAAQRAKIAKDQLWNRKLLNSAILQGIQNGESIEKIAKRLAEVAEMDKRQAIRNARTATTAAENGGRVYSYEKAEEMGIEMMQEWLATLDGRTRHSHRQLDGEKVKVGEPFKVVEDGIEYEIRYPGDPEAEPEMIYNCFVGNTKIASDSEIIRSYKHKYQGELFTIKTASGIEFTCTPNHPILTVDGWRPVKLLNKGDNLIVATRKNNRILRVNPNIKHTFPSIKAIHNLFDVVGSKRTCHLGVDFHGDVPATDVEIITQKRFLRSDRNASGGKSVNKFFFKHSNSFALGQRHFVKRFGTIRQSTFGDIGIMSKPLTFFKRRLRHSQIHRCRTTSGRNANRFKPLLNNVSRDVKLVCQRFDRTSFKIGIDNVISINVSSGCTHVYNLQTENNYYFVNSSIPQKQRKVNGNFAIAQNCRCTLVASIKGVDNSHNERTTSMMTSYEDWKEGKRVNYYPEGWSVDITKRDKLWQT